MCNIRLFAHDTSLYVIVGNPRSASISLTNSIDAIYSWSKRWLVDFNPNKPECMTFSKRGNIQQPPLYMNNILLKEVFTHKHLGITFSSDGSWSSQIGSILNKARFRLS